MLPRLSSGTSTSHGRKRARTATSPAAGQAASTAADNALFTSFVINRDQECKRYLPYSEVSYPRLFQRPKATSTDGIRAPSCGVAELDSMWLVSHISIAGATINVHASRMQSAHIATCVQQCVARPFEMSDSLSNM